MTVFDGDSESDIEKNEMPVIYCKYSCLEGVTTTYLVTEALMVVVPRLLLLSFYVEFLLVELFIVFVILCFEPKKDYAKFILFCLHDFLQL